MNDVCKKLAPEYVLAANGEIIPSAYIQECTWVKGKQVQCRVYPPFTFKNPIPGDDIFGRFKQVEPDMWIAKVRDGRGVTSEVMLNPSYKVEDLKEIWTATHEPEDFRDYELGNKRGGSEQ